MMRSSQKARTKRFMKWIRKIDTAEEDQIKSWIKKESVSVPFSYLKMALLRPLQLTIANAAGNVDDEIDKVTKDLNMKKEAAEQLSRATKELAGRKLALRNLLNSVRPSIDKPTVKKYVEAGEKLNHYKGGCKFPKSVLDNQLDIDNVLADIATLGANCFA